MASLEKDLRDSKDELIRLRSINLSVSKDQIESLKKCETQLKDKVIILFIICCYPLFIA